MFFISPVLIPALFWGVVLYDFFNSEVPPGIEQPLKLHTIMLVVQTSQHYSFQILSLQQGKILEKLGICNDFAVLRAAVDGIPPWRDSKLLIKDLTVDEVPLRIYQPKSPPTSKRRGILYFHGGAGTFGSISKKWASFIFQVKSKPLHFSLQACVNQCLYRLSPEHPYPGQYFDCLSATLYFMRNLEEYHVDPGLIIVSGDSCGANFATVICQILLNDRDLPKVRAQVLLYPGLQGLDFQLPSYQQNAFGPILPRKLVIYFCFRYLNRKPTVLKDIIQNCHVPESMRQKYKKWVIHEAVKEILAGTFSPLLAEDSIICQLPESCIVTCEFDVLRDDGLLYKKRLEDNGVPVTWHHCKHGFHGILAFFDYLVLNAICSALLKSLKII
uniref:Alpha/beta hydrolase fold-3 domain-containing protein n=1 Tax=Catharus ustulatus TaxID=91951 RepID=A0A8C3UBM3_CATUS